MKSIKENFILGFYEGWTAFWLPFIVVAKGVKKIVNYTTSRP